jgi:hypothetical protein
MGRMILRSIGTATLTAGGLIASAALAEDTTPATPGSGVVSNSGSASGMVTGSTIDLIVTSLEKAGFEVELTETDDGKPKIESTDKETPFAVHFYGCTDGKDCGYIQFVNGWDMKSGVSAVKIEQWNADQIWGQAYRDKDRDPWVAMTVNLRGGVSVENFDDTVEWWANTIDEFSKHIGWAED